MAKTEDIIKEIETMSVMELSELVKAIEEKFGVSAQAPVMAAGMVPQAAGAAAEEEKSIFNVVITSVGSSKIQVIKEVRALTSLGLKEAKDLVDSVPKAIKEGVPKEEADEMKKKLEAAGAAVELK